MSSAEMTDAAAAEVMTADDDLMTSSAANPLPEKTSQSSSSGEQISLPEPSISVNEVSIDMMAAVTPPRSLRGREIKRFCTQCTGNTACKRLLCTM